MSMLRTYRDRAAKFPIILIYCNSSWDEVVFCDELEVIPVQIQLTLVHGLQEPPEDWQGESGLLDEAMLDRYLPTDLLAHEYFICGPEPLMNAVEPAILRRGVTARHVYNERFDMV